MTKGFEYKSDVNEAVMHKIKTMKEKKNNMDYYHRYNL